MITLYVEEMSCGHCVERIGSTLSKAEVIHTIDLDKKQVAIDGDHEMVELAIEELDDIGFSAKIL